MEQTQSNALEIKVSSQEELEEIIVKINSELNRYTSDITKQDYALAIASGVLCGAIDAIYVGESIVTHKDIGNAHEQINRFLKNYARKHTDWDGYGHMDRVVGKLEDTFRVAQDNVFQGKNIGVSATTHHLADLAHHPTPVGLMSAIVVQFLRVGTFVNQKGEWQFVLIDTDPKELVEIWMPAVVTGILNWLVTLAKGYSEERNKEMPEALWKLVRLIASTPLLIEVLSVASNWFGHLVSDMAGSQSKAGKGMGIPGVFLSLLYEIGSVPPINKTGLLATLNHLYVDKDSKFNLRKELAYAEVFGKQALPVTLNELFVHTFFFVSRLQKELAGKATFETVSWQKVMPVHHRTIDQMMAVASITFTAADTTDAAVRAAVDSGGNFAIFAGRFACRFNYIGAGRAVVAVGKEISNEKKEAQIIHEKRLLVQAKTEINLELIAAYRAELEALVASYMVDHLEAIQLGFRTMDQGLEEDDVDLFLQGNRYLQEVFGKQEIQFGTQEEFDELMDSDETFNI